MIKAVGNGVLIQGISGVHSGVNPISGDFSVGAEGLLIRDGSIAEPVREFTIASTVQEMLMNISHLGSDLELLAGAASGSSIASEVMSWSGS